MKYCLERYLDFIWIFGTKDLRSNFFVPPFFCYTTVSQFFSGFCEDRCTLNFRKRCQRLSNRSECPIVRLAILKCVQSALLYHHFILIDRLSTNFYKKIFGWSFVQLLNEFSKNKSRIEKIIENGLFLKFALLLILDLAEI